MSPLSSSVASVRAGRAMLSAGAPTAYDVEVTISDRMITSVRTGDAIPQRSARALDDNDGSVSIGGVGMLLMPALAYYRYLR